MSDRLARNRTRPAREPRSPAPIFVVVPLPRRRSCARCCRAAEWTWTLVPHQVPPSRRRGPRARRRRGAGVQREVRRRPSRGRCGCRSRELDQRARRPRPGASGPRSRNPSSAPARSTPTSAAPIPPPRSCPGGTVTERWVPVDRVGLYVPGGNAVYPSSVVMNVVPAQVAGVGSLVVGVAAAGRVRRSAAPDHPRRGRPARRRRGVGRRRRAGRRAAHLRRHRHRRRRTRPGRPDHRPRATSTSPPPSGCCADSSASTPRPAPPRSRSSPTTPPTRCTSPPT